ncbi:MAG: DotD/TraH family lipoprotein [Rhodospirillaceae bacterium]|nr:DotD/TraH family lipoprotein [Rhodospirillaceae bacterium]
MREIAIAAAAALSLASASCADGGASWTKGNRDSEIDRELRAAMKRAAEASAAVAGLEIAAATDLPAPGPAPRARDLPRELRTRISVDWTGPMEPLAKVVAEAVGYRFDSSGPRSATPLMISIHRIDEPAWRVLRDIGISAGASAALVVDARAKRIEFRRAGSGS